MPMRIDKPALLVIDMSVRMHEEHFREFAEGIVPQVNDAIALARELKMPIYYSQHGHPDPATDHNRNVIVSYLGASNSIKKDGPGYQLLPELNIDASKGDVQIEKDVYDAFLGTIPSQKTDLARSLRDRGCNGIIVVGVCTNLCSETTARAAVCRGFGIVMVHDANATYTQVKQRIEQRGLEDAFPIGEND